MWDWKSGKTWAGIGLGAIAGGLGRAGFATMGPALAGTGFFSHFGTSGAVAAFGLTGTAMGGAAGYATGFGGGALASNGNWAYARQAGGFYSGIGAAIGSVAGSLYGLTSHAQQYLKKAPVLPPSQQLGYSTDNPGINTSGLQSEISPMYLESELRYNGPNLQWYDNYSNGTSRYIDSWSTTTVFGGLGPLPNGLWTTGETVSPTWNYAMEVGDADFAIPLQATFNLMGRSGFYIHPDGNVVGTAGCIGLNGTEERMLNFKNRYDTYYSRYGSMRLRVQWAILQLLLNF